VDRRCFIVRDADGQALAWVSLRGGAGPASSSHGVRCHPAVMRGQLQFELARAAYSCLPVRTHLRFSAAQAAKRSTKSSKPKQGQRGSISKSHAVFAGDHSLPAKGSSS